MTCAESTSLFSEYLDAQIAGTTRREFDEHVCGCHACAQKLELMHFVRAGAGKLERKRVPDTFNFEMRRLLLAEMTRQSGWLHRLRIALSPRPQTVWSAAVGTAFATVCFVGLWIAFPPGGQPVWNSDGVAESESALEGQSVRYVLEHLPLDGEPIESTGKDTARVIPVLSPQAATAVQPVSATF